MRISDWSSDVCSSDLETDRQACDRHRGGIMMLADEGSGLLEGIDDIHGEVSGIDLGGTRHPVAAPIAPALASGGDHERQLRLRPRLLPPCRDRRREKAGLAIVRSRDA